MLLSEGILSEWVITLDFPIYYWIFKYVNLVILWYGIMIQYGFTSLAYIQ